MTARDEPTYATAGAVAGLASEVEGLRKRVEPLQKVPRQVAQIAGQLNQLAEQVGELVSRPGPAVVRSWLALDGDGALASEVLDALTAWLRSVFLRYPDAAAVLPECWVWHPDVVEELLWLMRAWQAAYFDDDGGVLRVADWHDRYRPGVVRRLKSTAQTCSLEQHSPPQPPPSVPLEDATEQIAEWWAHHRSEPAPEPTEDQFAAAAQRQRRGGRR